MGDIKRAQSHFKSALQIGQEICAEFLICLSLVGFAHVAAAYEKPRRAARLWGAAEAQMEEIMQRLGPADQMTRDHFIALARQQCDQDTFDREWTAGRAMSLAEAAEYALELDLPDLPDF
jgi:hypothetical protein